LSPYLFDIVADVLQQLIVGDSSMERLRHPLVDDLPCPVIQYADDTLLLLRADETQLRRARCILESFSRATGLAINYNKSSFVPIGVGLDDALPLAAIFGCPLSEFPQKYLGLPLTATKLRVRDLDQLVVKVERRVPGWKGPLLPSGGRLILTDAGSLRSRLMRCLCSFFTTPPLGAWTDRGGGCYGKGARNTLEATVRLLGGMSVVHAPRVAWAFETCWSKTCASS
jgi:hypothetical protein